MKVRSLSQLYRGLATGFCFFVFGFGQLLEALFVFPLLVLFVRDPVQRARWGKRVMHWGFGTFVGLMRAVGVISVETRNLERLQRPGLLVLANHPTLIDIVILIGLLPAADCIVKGSLLKNPFTRFAIGAAALIPNDLEGIEVVNRCVQSMESGNSLVIFPEGSRSEPNHLLPFQRGASHIAVRGKRDITPVVIRVSEHNLGRGTKWYLAPPKPMRFVIEVLDDIPVQPFVQRHAGLPGAARELTRFLADFFHRQLSPERIELGNDSRRARA